MANAADRVAITISQTRDVTERCYPPVAEFVAMLTDVLSGEAQGDFGNLVISQITPDSEDVNKVWIEINGQRTFFTLKVHVNGEWRPWYFVPPNTYMILDGRAPIPDGWQAIGRFSTAILNITPMSTVEDIPSEFIIIRFIGF